MFLYDSFGCALGGSRKPKIFKIMHETFPRNRRARGMFGNWFKLARRMFAVQLLINSLAIRALDYNDVYWKQDPSSSLGFIAGGVLHRRTRKTAAAKNLISRCRNCLRT